MKLLEPPTLAERLGVPETTLAQWRYRGIGPRYAKVGRHVRYREEDVEAWLDAQSRGGGDDHAA
jgi:excisionase family DNA binding protein